MIRNFNRWALLTFSTVALAFVGCTKDCPTPSEPDIDPDPEVILPSGSNWILLGDDAGQGGVTTLRSAIYAIAEDGTYTFYFSEDAGLTTDTDMLTSETLLTITGVTPTGRQTAAKAVFTTPSRTISSEDYAISEIDVNLYYNGAVKLAVAMTEGASDNFRASYAGQCLETGYPNLGGNAVAVNKEQPVPIGSVVELRNEKTGLWTYYLYEEEDVRTADPDRAIFTIVLPKTLVEGAVAYEEGEAPDFSQNFSEGLAEGTELLFSSLPERYAHHAHGSLYAGFADDPTGPYKRNIRMEYSSDDEGTVVRLNWLGTVWATYDSENSFSVKIAGAESEYDFTHLFMTNDGIYTSLLFGTVDTGRCEDLKSDGKNEIAAKWTFAGLEEGLFTELNDVASWALYNYATLDTYVNGGKKGTTVSGSYRFADCPNADGDEVYILFDILYSSGERITGEWYGPMTETTPEKADIAPEKPTFYITFTDAAGKELEKLELVDVYHEYYDYFPIQGYKFTRADTFYFQPDEVDTFGKFEYRIPQISFHPDYIDGEEYDLSYEYASRNGWYQPFMVNHYSPNNTSRWANTSSFPSGGWSSSMQTTAAGSMKVSHDETSGLWDIYIKVQDLIYNYRGVGFPYGAHTDNFMIIEYHGSVNEL